ncbi:glycosyltransferase family 4 protein [Luteibacter sp.]|jgi:glycosyltransferase involved in cell wall biosynthesis|uniref:glycosyltransferase family 4 protein n=1 Tax=Luteibacter sp. TaxID=1886636 RepID=UPI002F3F125C
MRIAQVAPLYEAVPPRLYGGTERVVSHLTEALVAQGHDVTLFAAADAVTQARLSPGRDQALRLDPTPLKSELAAHLSMLHDLRERIDEFDVVHFHTDMLHFPLFESLAERTLTTLHGRLDMKDLPDTYRRWHRYPLVSISQAQRAPMPFAHWFGNVPHGLDPASYEMPDRPKGDYLAFLGRIAPEKRPDRAVAIARAVGMPLRIAAKVDGADRDYFEQAIRPLFASPDIEFIGEIGDDEKADFLGHAHAVLFPIDWPEPFGLVMIEAMACGVPVIAWRHGSVPEVIDDGVTGFIVKDLSAAAHAVSCAGALDRRHIRQVFEQRFTAQTMALGYTELYERLGRPLGLEADACLTNA